MRLFLDSNIIISTFLTPSGTPAKAVIKALTENHALVSGSYNVGELLTTIAKKFVKRDLEFAVFWEQFRPYLELVETPETVLPIEEKIRDAKDRPILRAAIFAKADIFLTGDKDFLEAGIETPKIMTAAEFLANY